MKFVLLLAFLFMWLANPITGGKLFPGFNNPEKWMKRVIRKLQRKTSAYGNMIASNTAEISNTVGFISSIAKCESNFINDPDNGLSCCFEDNLNKGQCLCNGMTIDDTSNPGSCCMANQEHPDHCLCSGTDMDDPTNPGNCCFANSGQRLCAGNYTDVPSKRCFNLDWKGDGICDDQNNHGGCNFDGGDCCGDNVDTDLCTQCQCLEGEAPLPNAVGCCYRKENNSQECLCTGTEIDDPDTLGSCCMDDVDYPGNCSECDGYKVENHPAQCLCTGTNIDDPNTPGSCCMDDVDNPGNCFQCNDLTTCNGNGTCIGNTGKCECNGGFTGDHCDILTCPGKPICGGVGTCPEGGMVCQCEDTVANADCSPFGSSSFPQRYIMVTAGGPNSAAQLTEVIDIVDPTRTCNPMQNFPGVFDDRAWIPQGGIINGVLVVCGYFKCYAYGNDAWSKIGNDYTPSTQFSSATVLKGNTPTEDRLWIARPKYAAASMLVSSDGQITTWTTSFINNCDRCCVVNQQDGKILQLGGYHLKAKRVLRHDTVALTTEELPNMLESRSLAGCALFYSAKHEYRPVAYIGGGGHWSGGNYQTAELLDFTQTDQWEKLPDLPVGPNDGSKALPTPTNDGVLHIWNSEIYRMDCTTDACSWTTLPKSFTSDFKRNYGFAALYIPEELTDCSPPLE